jgi:hypothetical protein
MSGWHSAFSFVPLQAMLYSLADGVKSASLYTVNPRLIQSGISAVQQFWAAGSRALRLPAADEYFFTVIQRRKMLEKQCKSGGFMSSTVLTFER